MEQFDMLEHPHRRYNILTGEWVLVSPHRTKRPWQGKQEKVEEVQRPQHDPGNYLGPGNLRAGGERNPDYKSTYVFRNDFGALYPEVPKGSYEKGGLLKAVGEQGICKVVCFSPRFDLTLPEMALEDIVKVIETWQEEYRALGSEEFINYVQIFENKGEIMGCSNPHPHGQIWAQSTIPEEPAKEGVQMKQYFEERGRSLLSDYVALELEEKERVVLENESFVAVVPFWAVWPYETMIVSKRHFQDINMMTEEEKRDFAEILKQLTTKYDNLFEISFPYSSGIHQRPTDGQLHEEWHFHMHFYPPLLRSATVKKFMVGYEMMAEPQRDITAEFSADKLRYLSLEHYKSKKH